MQLTDAEAEALMELISDMGPDRFDHLLFLSTGVRYTEFASIRDNILTISLECLSWLRANSHHAPKLLERAVEKYPAHPSVPVLRQAEDRLRTIRARQDRQGPVNRQVLAGGVPVVNRDHLRGYLAMLIAGQDPLVVVVEGESGLGRSHSWNLIQHVAVSLPRVKPISIDLIGPILSQQSLPRLFDHLARVLGLPPGEMPTHDGVTSTTLSERFLGEFVTRLQSMPMPWHTTPWIVFDHLDRNIAVEIKLFVMGLASLRLQRVFGNCVIFLLGPDPTVPLTDPAALAHREPLSAFLDYEITKAVTSLNDIGQNRLDDVQLETRLNALRVSCGGLSGRERAAAVCSELVALRQLVGAG
jgi:hypothetical protein